MSRRARERANARPWEQGEQPEPDDHQVQRRAGWNPPDISASGAAWRSRDDGGY